ncbi:MAG: hypothetical protein IJ719_17625 [Clostridia bacterium]|nr:hypothetical protein [Clostridia bacterium]
MSKKKTSQNTKRYVTGKYYGIFTSDGKTLESTFAALDSAVGNTHPYLTKYGTCVIKYIDASLADDFTKKLMKLFGVCEQIDASFLADEEAYMPLTVTWDVFRNQDIYEHRKPV